MRTALLIRTSTGDEGTFGHICVNDKLVAYTVEPPWRNNQRDISCIFQCTYRATPYRSNEHGECYRLQDVPNRDDILIHAGNWAGDRQLGRRSNSQGCILPGKRIAVVDTQRGVSSSQDAMIEVLAAFGGDDIELTVVDAWRVAVPGPAAEIEEV